MLCIIGNRNDFTGNSFNFRNGHQILIKIRFGCGGSIRHDPGDGTLVFAGTADNHFPEGIRCFHAMRFQEIVIIRIVAPDDATDDQQFVGVAVAFGNFFREQPGAAVHLRSLRQDVRHVIRLSDPSPG